MSPDDYRTLLPLSGEDQAQYALRLQSSGYEEMFMRKALRCHYQMRTGEFPVFFEEFEQARLEHIRLLSRIEPSRSDYSLTLKTSKNLGITVEQAQQLVRKFRSRQLIEDE